MWAEVKRLRCWARRAQDSQLCRATLHHLDDYHTAQNRRSTDSAWMEQDCAMSADSIGRETAALRILEVSHEVDREAFLVGDTWQIAAGLRAMAARLYVDDKAAQQDYADIVNDLAELRPIDGATREALAVSDRVTALIRLAADFLRPFAVGT